MKNKGKLFLTIPFTLLAITSLSSCSSFIDSTRKMVGADDHHKKKKQVKWVSKAQHDDLIVKYKNLSEKYERLKDEKLTSPQGYNQLDEISAPSMPAAEPSIKDDTVDVFGKGGLANQVANAPKAVPVAETQATSEIDQELKTYKKAIALRIRGKEQDALKIFQLLERSRTKQIRVRSRLNIGEIYLKHRQYDLALQVFENMIFKDSFSGKVLEALKGAIACSENLGLNEKKDKYQSILVDFFGIQS